MYLESDRLITQQELAEILGGILKVCNICGCKCNCAGCHVAKNYIINLAFKFILYMYRYNINFAYCRL